MLREKRLVIVGAVSAMLLANLFMVFNKKGQAKQNNQQGAPITRQAPSSPTAKELDDAASPIVDLNSSPAVSPHRLLKNTRHDNRPFVKTEIDPRVTEVRVEASVGVSDIPTDRSDLVVEGVVTDSAAFLSNDRGMVYSEFTVRVTEILKSTSVPGVSSGNLIVTERLGGRVRYPDGRIIRYRLVGQGSPVKGKMYLLFLSESGQGNYTILTAYELDGNRVFALDGSRINHRSLGNWVFDKHNQEDYEKFRGAVERAIKNPQPGAETRRSAP